MKYRATVSALLIWFLAVVSCCGQENTNNEQLKDALEMIYQRQNALKQFDNHLSDSEYSNNINGDYERSIDTDDELTLPYNMFYQNDELPSLKSKRKYSVFRERSNNDDEHSFPLRNTPHHLNELFYDESANTNDDSDESDYMNLLEEYWERYNTEKKLAEARRAAEIQRYLQQADSEYIRPNKRVIYKRLPRQGGVHLPYLQHTDNIVLRKRFPIIKRSSDTSTTSPPSTTNLPKTDPKVERDLNDIFAHKKTKTPKKVVNEMTKTNATTQKETVFLSDDTNKSIDMKKKSIDWSKYFGIDKRASDNFDLANNPEQMDNWMLERYKNVLNTLTHADDNKSMKQRRTDQTKLEAIKNKLTNIEDMIIDEALKYTGAHEGDTDSAEVQQVKDQVMSRLAAVYSLEKMRRALTEFKNSIAEQRKQMKTGQLNGDFDILATDDDDANKIATTSVPNSSTFAVKEDSNGVPAKKNDNQENNNINQQTVDDESNDDCEILQVIDRQCNHLATKAGEQLIQPLCTLHQICTLCGVQDGLEQQTNKFNFIENANTDLACYYLYVTQSERACAGDTQCRRRANYALNILRETTQSPNNNNLSNVRNDICPQSSVCVGSFLETAKRRLSFSPYIMGRHSI